ncbi:hypothetical protein ABKV19_019093 [Rosa sericea]
MKSTHSPRDDRLGCVTLIGRSFSRIVESLSPILSSSPLSRLVPSINLSSSSSSSSPPLTFSNSQEIWF